MNPWWAGYACTLVFLVPIGPWELEGRVWCRDFVDDETGHTFTQYGRELVSEPT